MTRFGILGIAIVALFSAAAEGATYYVATTGSDVSSGALSAPFRTITKAASVAKAGDVVNVRGGVYNEVVKIASKGTADARITFQSHPGELAIIDAGGSPANTNLVQISSAEYVDFNNFEVRGATRIGICLWGTRNVRVVGNRVHGSQKAGIYVGYSSFGSAVDNTLERNEVFNNVLENQYHTINGGWSQAIGANFTERTRIIGNRVYKNDGEGIVFVMSDHGFAQGNEVFDNFSVQMYLDNAQYSTFDSNFVYSTGDRRYYRNGMPAHGIGMANETYSTTNPLSDNVISNNIVLHSRWGLYYGDYENGGGMRNTTIANNTFYGATVELLHIDAAAHVNSTIQNNVFYAADGGALAKVEGSGVAYRSNAWYGGSAGAASGAGDIIGDPQLLNPGGDKAADYKLAASSPVLQRGASVGPVSRDYFGTARVASVDIGAHQLSASAELPASSPNPPAAPAPSSGRKRSVRP